jgi:hypothetical protein
MEARWQFFCVGWRSILEYCGLYSVFMAKREDLDYSLEFSDIVLLIRDTRKHGKEAT